MENNTIQSHSEHVTTSQSVHVDGHFCSADQIFNGVVRIDIDNVSQNSSDLSNNTSTCQSLDISDNKGLCYHERTSSCESTASSLSCSSYNSSNASGILLNVSSLGPDPPLNCDVSLINKNCPSDSVDSSNATTIKPDIVDNISNSNSKQEDSRKSKKLIDFSVIKLRGRNILNNKHDSVKMGQSANTTSSESTQNSDILKISSCQNYNMINNCEDSKNFSNKTQISCDKTMDEIDNRLIEKSPQTESQIPLDKSKMAPSNASAGFTDTSSAASLELELGKARSELKQKDEEILKLSRIRDEVESEMSELTASLFQEAHRMVEEANVKRASAEKYLAESNMKIDGLETEVAALKTLVLTSTPSQPNRHLHPQLSAMDHKSNSSSQNKSNGQTTNNSLLQGNLKTGNNKSPMGSISSLSSLNASSIVIGAGGLGNCTTLNSTAQSSEMTGAINTPNDPNADLNEQLSGSPYGNGVLVPVGCTPNSGGEMRNVDPNLRQEYLEWKKNPSLDRDSSEFLNRIYKEDIDLCLDFPIDKDNQNLKSDLHEAIHKQSICITPLKPEKNEFRKHCPLLNSKNVLCKFHVRLGLKDNSEDRDELFISQLARNRITAVCTFLNYLDYIIKGLVKSHHNDVYWEILQLRKSMVLARFGFSPD